jgi:hypothetical protein
MASQLLVNVTEVFRMRDGTVVVPDEFEFPSAKPEDIIQVTLRRPDGSDVMKQAVICLVLANQHPYKKPGFALRFPATEKAEIPIGTEVLLEISSAAPPQT